VRTERDHAGRSFVVSALMIAYMQTMMLKTYTHLITAPATPSEQRERTTR
jgi:hypothetical protein